MMQVEICSPLYSDYICWIRNNYSLFEQLGPGLKCCKQTAECSSHDWAIVCLHEVHPYFCVVSSLQGTNRKRKESYERKSHSQWIHSLLQLATTHPSWLYDLSNSTAFALNFLFECQTMLPRPTSQTTTRPILLNSRPWTKVAAILRTLKIHRKSRKSPMAEIFSPK